LLVIRELDDGWTLASEINFVVGVALEAIETHRANAETQADDEDLNCEG